MADVQLALFDRDACPLWPHFCGGQAHYPGEATLRLELQDLARRILTLGLVPCSAKKVEQRGALPARELYQGRIFQAALRASEQLHDATLIVSGAHGALHPDQTVPPYNYRLRGPRALKQARAVFTAGEIAAFIEAFAPGFETSLLCQRRLRRAAAGGAGRLVARRRLSHPLPGSIGPGGLPESVAGGSGRWLILLPKCCGRPDY